MQRFKKWLISKLFTETERELIINAVCDYTNFGDDVVVEHDEDSWYMRMQSDATNIVNKVNLQS